MTDEVPVLRPARPEDGPLLHAWRNDAATRAASLDTAEIPLAAHLDWYRTALANPARQILLAELGGTPVGMTRFDLGPASGEARQVTVSIMLAPQARGRGLGRAVLLGGLANCRFHGYPLIAVIRRDNPASLSIFAAAGFHPAARQTAGADLQTLIKEPTP